MLLVISTFIFGQNDTNPNADLQKMYVEYLLINQKLQLIQVQALSDSVIAMKTKEFRDALDSAMVKKNPSIKDND